MLKKNTAYLCGLLSVVMGIGLALFALQLNCATPSTPPSRVCVGFGLFKEMQTLVAGIIALGAALMAVRPVYLQLEKMRIQTDIAARESIAKRTQMIEQRARHDLATVRTIHTAFMAMMDNEYTEFPPGLDVHWLMYREDELRNAKIDLLRSNGERMGTKRVEFGRDKLMFAVDGLLQCVGKLTAYEEMDQSGEYTDDQIQEAVENARRAEPELYTKWQAVNGAINRFQIDIDFEVDRLRRRIRQIDDSAVESNF